MFGNVAACRHTLGDHHDRWMAALCGTCLGVRDVAGQAARALVVTDAVALAVLAAEVAGAPVATRAAGRCPARRFETATVLAADAVPVKVAVAATLLAGTAKLADVAVDRDAPGGRLTSAVAGRWSKRLGPVAAAAAATANVDHAVVRTALVAAADAERRSSPVLDDWTEPTATATGALFRAAAVGREDELAAIGAEVGRATLLADAVGDVDRDRRAGIPNPILAGACTADEAVDRVAAAADTVALRVHHLTGDGLAAALWGPAWRTGLRRATGRRRLGACGCRAQHDPASPAPEAPPGGSTWDPVDGGSKKSRRRKRGGSPTGAADSTWCTACDCCGDVACCCACDSLCDCCDCCDCGV